MICRGFLGRQFFAWGADRLLRSVRAKEAISKAVDISSMAQSGQKQLVPLHIEEVDHTIISCAQAKLWPALESPVGKGLQATPQIANISYNSRSSGGR